MSNDQPLRDTGPTAVHHVEKPPTTVGGILLRLGPGLIVAGSIVGSGELIATTATGAQAGFWLLWLILIGCVIKVFVQVELGRYAITVGKTTMDGLAEVPGPRIAGRGNWLVWYWFLMFIASLAQLGGIVGGVGQALAISAPLTAGGRAYNAYAEAETQRIVVLSELTRLEQRPAGGGSPRDDKIDQAYLHVFRLEQESNRQLAALKRVELERARASRDDRARNDVGRLEKEIDALSSMKRLFARLDPPQTPTVRLVGTASSVLFTESKLRAVRRRLAKHPNDREASGEAERLAQRWGRLKSSIAALERERQLAVLGPLARARESRRPPPPIDDKLWASIVTAITVLILVIGRYGAIQSVSTALVASFTLITVVNLALLQSSPSWGLSLTNILDGLRFRLPPGDPRQALATALATFGIIGVGASELVTYPYWCLEKGYARFTGPRDPSPEWAARARGWMRVMRWDAWCSMVVYTFATLAFYLLGAAVLSRTGLDPKGTEMIRYLSVMYEPVFGQIAQILFLFGAFAVLYSTFFVANASHARVLSDVLRVLNFAAGDEGAYRRRVRLLSGLLPLLCLLFYWSGWDPKELVLLSGLMQAMMLPMLAAAGLFFRYWRCDQRIAPGKLWDVFLWVSAAGMLVAGAWAAWAKVLAPLVGLN